MRIFLAVAALSVAVTLSSCGGGSSSSTPSTSNNQNPGTPTPPQPATAVTVTSGQTTSGVDITVSAPAATPQENAQDLGVNDACRGGSAFNVGDVIHRGDSKQMLIFGPGLTSNVAASVLGPSDIQLTFVATVHANDADQTPGVCLDVIVSANAALGARTVMVQASNGDITTLTGGLEVLP